MPRPELHRTLVAAVEAVSPPAGSGLVVTAADIDLPLEIVVGERDGRPVVAGTAPHTRWESGFLPQVHLGRLRIEATETDGA
jgi:hypothetical protein